MDITLGDEDSSTYFGILIRAIMHTETNDIIEGPCKVVNEILSKYECENIHEFVSGENLNIINNPRKFIVKKSSKLKQMPIFQGPRIGLSDKYPKFKDQPYRFVIFKDKIKKEKTKLKMID